MSKRESFSYDLMWISFVLLFVLGVFFYKPIPANDYWWYLRVGHDVLQTAAVPSIESISYSRAGEAIINQQWLAGILFYLVHQYGGVNLTYLLGGICLAFTYGMVWWLARRVSGPKLATILVYILVLSTSNNWVMRPQLLVYPLFMLCTWCLLEWQDGSKKYLFVLPVSVLLWVNLHGSFILPFVLMLSALIFGQGDRKALIWVILVSLIASMINPYGINIIRFLITQLTVPSNTFSTEWRPPSMADWQDKLFFICLFIFAPLGSFFSERLSKLDWFWFLGFGWLALSGSRYVIWFLFLLTIFYAKTLAQWSNSKIDFPVYRTSFGMNIVMSAFILILSFSYFPAVKNIWQNIEASPYDLETTPINAVNWLLENDIKGEHIWNDYAFGSYLAFALPEQPVYIDTRVHNYPYAQWDEYLKVNNAQNWQEVFEREGVNLLILSTKRQPVLIQAVSDSAKWKIEYQDQYALIYSRKELFP